jgi:hypothetical protein
MRQLHQFVCQSGLLLAMGLLISCGTPALRSANVPSPTYSAVQPTAAAVPVIATALPYPAPYPALPYPAPYPAPQRPPTDNKPNPQRRRSPSYMLHLHLGW